MGRKERASSPSVKCCQRAKLRRFCLILRRVDGEEGSASSPSVKLFVINNLQQKIDQNGEEGGYFLKSVENYFNFRIVF